MADTGAIVTGSWSGVRRAAGLVLAVFALLLQMNAPVGSLMMTVGEDGAAICAVHHEAGQRQEDKAPTHRTEACTVCSLCALTGPAVLPAAVVALAFTLIATVALEILRQVAPRGPPARTPRARGPPILA
jgi:hypothetical protein